MFSMGPCVIIGSPSQNENIGENCRELLMVNVWLNRTLLYFIGNPGNNGNNGLSLAIGNYVNSGFP